MLVSVVAGAMALMMSTAVQEADVSAAAAAEKTAPAETVKKKEKLVCKSQRTTGSRMASRVCKTAADWEERRAASNEKVEDWQKEPRRPMAEGGDGEDNRKFGAASSGRQSRVRDRPPAQDPAGPF